jgi:UDP-N-acetylmuramoylalanine--D-glutamate ligase
LKSNKNIYWLLGGIPKKGDEFNLPKKYFKNIEAFIYGKDRKFFNKKLKGKIIFENFISLKDALIKILSIIKKEKFIRKTIIFSPSAASFDSFKNFEDRGLYFNKLVKRYLNGI